MTFNPISTYICILFTQDISLNCTLAIKRSHLNFLAFQELDSGLKSCKDEFKEFERQDVKFREDLKHLKQKIKKLDDKVEKVDLKYSTL